MKYKSFITDLHLNLHPNQIDLLEKWYEHSKKVTDFFTLAYYPYHMVKCQGNFMEEEEISNREMEEQWEKITKFLIKKEISDDYISFSGFEWQGKGMDGDHNIYFKNINGNISLPERYNQLVDKYKNYQVIGIPHHLAYSLGNRGKNWVTHNEKFSPFVEVYSHHGSSERDLTSIKMERHIHMGPRVDKTSVVSGIKAGYHFGIIASGDNHEIPAMVKNGRAGVWAEEYSRDGIWNAFTDRRVFGFTDSKIIIWTEMDGNPMGSIIRHGNDIADLKVKVIANSKIERLELYRDGELEKINLAKNELFKPAEDEIVKFKFKIECGWGPNVNFFPEFTEKIWNGNITTKGEIKSVEQIYSSFDNSFERINMHSVEFHAKSSKNSGDSWMRDEAMNNEGFIFEIEAPYNSDIIMEINGKRILNKVKDLFKGSSLVVFEDEAKQLVKEKSGLSEFYRSDSWYHNAYKIKLYQAINEQKYKIEEHFEIYPTDNEENYFVKVIQSDGQTGWSSPIWISK